MRINDNNIPASDSTRIDGARQAQDSGAKRLDQAASSREGDDHVSLSGLASTVASLDPSSPERQATLDKLQALIDGGRYAPDNQRVADSLIEDALSDGAAANNPIE